MKIKALCITLGSLLLFFTATSLALATTYYISPSGNDTNPGTSESSAWQSLSKVSDSLYPGDTAFFLDGTYSGTINPRRSGTQSAPITYKAKNDGKVVLNNNFGRPSILIVDYRGNKYLNFEGFVIINGGVYANYTGGGIYTDGGSTKNVSYITFKRISSYNADTDNNTVPIHITRSSNILIEDCIAAGTGRKMILAYFSEYITVRRCFANWTEFEGKDFSDHWPNSEGIDLYGSSNSIVENSINYANVPTYGFTIRAKDTNSTANNNKILGSISVFSGIDQKTQEIKFWPENETSSGAYVDPTVKPDSRVGLRFFGKSANQINGNIIKDFLAYGNSNTGIALGSGIYNANPTNTLIERVTLYDNMRDSKKYSFSGGIYKLIPNNVDFFKDDYDEMKTNGNVIRDSYIGRVWDYKTDTEYSPTKGVGAKCNLLNNHYIDGVEYAGSFWDGDRFPKGTTNMFPMEERGRVEIPKYVKLDDGSPINSFSITNTIKPIVESAPGGGNNCPTTIPTPTQVATTTPSPTQGPTATPIPTATVTPKPNQVIPVSVTASTHLDPYLPEYTIDNDLSTRWSGEGIGAWIQFDLGSTKNIQSIDISWYHGDERTSTIDILGSVDGQFWSTIQSQVASSGTTTSFETYDFPITQIKYLRIVGYGNSDPDSNWNSINELEIYQGTPNTKYDPKFDLNQDGSVNIMDLLELIKSIYTP